MIDHDSPDTRLPPAFTKQNERLSVVGRLSADRVKLFIECQPVANPQSALPTKDDLLALLDAVPRNLIHLEVLESIAQQLARGKPTEPRRIAKGRPAVNGRDGKLLLLVKKFAQQERAEIVTLRYSHAFDNIEQGTIVARLYPPTDGAPGIDALGAEIRPESGKPVKLLLESGLTLKPAAAAETFQSIVAEKAGYLREENGKLTLVDQLVVNSDVNYHTGDLNFVGSITVKGDVLKDFHVTARGDIMITGSCNDARITSTHGSVTVQGTVSGTTVITSGGTFDKQRGEAGVVYSSDGVSVQAAGAVSAACLQGVTVQAMGDITVGKEILGSIVHTRGALRMPKGNIVGGDIYTVNGVEAKNIGNASGVATYIHLCSDIESTVEYATLVHVIDRHLSAATMLKLQLGPYESNRSRLQLVKEPYRGKLMRLAAKYDEVKGALEKLHAEQRELLLSAKPMSTVRVNFGTALHEGTVILAEGARLAPKGVLKGPQTIAFSPADKTLAVTEFRPLEAPAKSTK